MSEEINESFSLVFSGRHEQFTVQTLVKETTANYSSKFNWIWFHCAICTKGRRFLIEGGFKVLSLCSSKYSSSDLIYPLCASCVCSCSRPQSQVPQISWIHIGLRVKSSSPWQHLPHACLSLSGQAAWIFLFQSPSNTKGWGIWAEREGKDMTEQWDNQLVKSVPIKHL